MKHISNQGAGSLLSRICDEHTSPHHACWPRLMQQSFILSNLMVNKRLWSWPAKARSVLEVVWRALRTDRHIIARPHVALRGPAWESKREEHAEGDEETHEDAGLDHHPHSASPYRDTLASAGYSSSIQQDVWEAMQPDRDIVL